MRAATLLALGFLSACASPLLAPDDRGHVCQVAVDEKFGSNIFHPNPLRNPAGVAGGAAAGALAGLIGGPMLFIAVPAFATMGAVAGAACGAASLIHPDAEADFERILKAADSGSLKRALQVDLSAPRAGCGRWQLDDSAAAAPDTVIEIESIQVGMNCVSEEQDYTVTVKWRVVTATTHKSLLLRGDATTMCRQESSRDVDAWLADKDQARLEIERVLAKTGQPMAAELLSPISPRELSACQFRLGGASEIEQR